MNGVYIRDLSCADYSRNVEVALRQLRRTNADGFVSKLDMQRMPVGLTVNRHRANAQFFASANHPQGNFATVRNKDFIEHLLNECRAESLAAFLNFDSQK